MNTKTSETRYPALKNSPGLIHHYAGISPEGSGLGTSHPGDTKETRRKPNHLKEMVVIARAEMEAVGVTFYLIVGYPISWTV